MHRFYADSAAENGFVSLAAEDRSHALRVLRLQPGDETEVFGSGRRWRAELTVCREEEVTARLLEALPDTEPRLQVTLYQGLPKGEKMELIVQKAVELGVHRIVPVDMQRCIVRLDASSARKKQERWQKIAREACKQSGRVREVPVDLPLAFPAFLESLAAEEAVLVPWEEARGCSLRSFHDAHPDLTRLGVVIGPEGGIEKREVEAMQAVHAQPVTLGPRILRTETAGLCAISALMCLWGEME